MRDGVIDSFGVRNGLCKVVKWHLLSLTLTLMQRYLCGVSSVVTSESLCCINMLGS